MPSATSPPRSATRRRLRVGAAAAGALTLLVTLVAASCASPSKEEVRTSLLALPKNARIAEHGLSEVTIRTTIDERAVDAAVTYLHVRPSAPAEPARRPVVLVHGTPGTLLGWVDAIFGGDGFEGLAADRDVYAVEVIGHGLSRTEPGDVTFQLCADWVVAFVDALAIGPVDLVGSSYGGEFVWRAALDRPDLVARVVLIDSSGPPRPDDGWMPEEEAMRDNPFARWGHRIHSPDRVATALQPQFHRAVTQDEIDELYWSCATSEDWNAMIDLAQDENGERFDELARLDRPVLLLWGEHDLAYPPDEYASRFGEVLPDSRLVVLPDCGHYPHVERPADAVRAIRSFLDD